MCKRVVLFIVPLFIYLTCSAAQTSNPVQPIILWPDGAPGALGREPADVPTLRPYLPPKERATGAAVIICPGGGYEHLSEREGRPVAEWFNSLGVAAFVLKYRLGPRYHHPVPFADATRAVRTVRARAREWGLDTDRIGMLGFSAGGHLASTVGTYFDAGDPAASDPIERVSSRPDVLVLIYPVITMGTQAHAGSKKYLLGAEPAPDVVALLSNEAHVTRETPPTFIVHTVNDASVPVENSLLFAAALKQANV